MEAFFVSSSCNIPATFFVFEFMESTIDSPYGFFDYYLNVKLYEHYDDFNQEQLENQYTYKDRYTTFIDYIGVPHKKELIKSKRLVEENVSRRLTDNTELSSYLNFLKIKLSTLAKTRAFDEFKFVKAYVHELREHLVLYSEKPIKADSTSTLPTFILLGNTNEEKEGKIDILYEKLTEHPAMISCTPEGFKKAFSGQSIDDGILWLVNGKNKMISKTSLFYLMKKLMDEGHLPRSLYNDLNKYVKSVFRDSKGEQLKNLKQSKATYSSNVAYKDRIDEIVSSI